MTVPDPLPFSNKVKVFKSHFLRSHMFLEKSHYEQVVKIHDLEYPLSLEEVVSIKRILGLTFVSIDIEGSRSLIVLELKKQNLIISDYIDGVRSIGNSDLVAISELFLSVFAGCKSPFVLDNLVGITRYFQSKRK